MLAIYVWSFLHPAKTSDSLTGTIQRRRVHTVQILDQNHPVNYKKGAGIWIEIRNDPGPGRERHKQTQQHRSMLVSHMTLRRSRH